MKIRVCNIRWNAAMKKHYKDEGKKLPIRVVIILDPCELEDNANECLHTLINWQVDEYFGDKYRTTLDGFNWHFV